MSIIVITSGTFPALRPDRTSTVGHYVRGSIQTSEDQYAPCRADWSPPPTHQLSGDATRPYYASDDDDRPLRPISITTTARPSTCCKTQDLIVRSITVASLNQGSKTLVVCPTLCICIGRNIKSRKRPSVRPASVDKIVTLFVDQSSRHVVFFVQ